MSNQPLITIFIPTYERPHLLKKAIESALAQTYKNIKVVVCDNASEDETTIVVDEIAKRDSRLKYIRHSKNIGMLNNYQFALSNVETEYFSFLSDDDVLFPNFCSTALKGFRRFPDIGFFAASTVSLSKNKGVICIPVDFWPREGRFSPEKGILEIIGKYPVPTTVLFQKSVIKYANIDFHNPTAWDCDFLIQLAGQLPFAISKIRCGAFLQHSNSFSSQQNLQSPIKPILRLIERVKTFPWMKENIKNSLLLSLKSAIYHNCLGNLSDYLHNNQFAEARKISLHLLIHYPLKIRTIRYCIFSFFPYLPYLFQHPKHLPTTNWKGFEKYKHIVKDL